MRFLVTGPRGYVGSAVCNALAARNHDVVALVRPGATGGPPLPRSTTARAELTDLAELASLAREVDGVFHGAASQDPAFESVSHAAVHAFLGALQPGAAFAMQAGSAVFGDTGDGAFDGTETPRPPPPLAAQSALEQRVLHNDSPTRRYVVYASLVYGGAGAMIPELLLAAAKRAGAAPFIGAGTNRWSTVFIEDWAALIALLLEAGPDGGQPFVAAAADVALRDVALTVAEAVLEPARVQSLSLSEAGPAFGFFAPMLAMNQRFSASRAENAVGWRPSGPSLSEEIRRLAATQR